jgi:hypothetical protein
MASSRNGLRRRLDALAEAARRSIRYRATLRDRSKAWAVIRPALAEAKVDPAQIGGLWIVDSAADKLSRLGDGPALQQAEAAFIASDRRMEPHESWEAKIADRIPGFGGQPPPRPGASLSDWYAWSLASRPERNPD